MAGEEDNEIPASGAVFTFGRSRFAENLPSHFFIRNDPVIDLDCGDEHTAVICQNGRIFVFGSNEWGQLGLGHKSVVNKPACIKSLKPEHATHLACGRAHTLISTGSGRVFACGNNTDGQLGVGDCAVRDIPAEVEGITGTVQQLAAGSNHSLALNNKGQVFVWGSNAEGQLGLGEGVSCASVPTLLPLQENVASIACGYYHTVLLTEEGQVLVCGEGEQGKLGLGNTDNIFVPTPVPMEAFLLFVTAGGNHTIAIAVDGRVYGWGSNITGQLGLSGCPEMDIIRPTVISSLSNFVIKEAACGESHTAFVTENGDLLTCGESRHGKLGHDLATTKSPVRVPKFKAYTVSKVKCGGCHTIVLASPRLDEADEQLTVVSNGYVTSPNKSLRPPEAGIVSPPPVSARGPLPPLQRVPLPVPTKHPESPTPNSNPVKITYSSIQNDNNHEDQILNYPVPNQSNHSREDPDNKVDVISLNGSVDNKEETKSEEGSKVDSVETIQRPAFNNGEVEVIKTVNENKPKVDKITEAKPTTNTTTKAKNRLKSKMCTML